MAEAKPATEKPAENPAEKPADKSGGQTEEESVNMQILKQKEKVNEGGQKLKILKTECNNEIKSFNENRNKIQAQIISNNYEVVNTDMSKCRILDGAGGDAARWVSGGFTMVVPRAGPVAVAVGDGGGDCQKLIPTSNGQNWYYSPLEKYMIDPRNINNKILERKLGKTVAGNLMDALPGSTALKQFKVNGLDGALIGLGRIKSTAGTKKDMINRALSAASNVFGFVILCVTLITIGGMVGGFPAFLPLIISVVLSLLVNLVGKDNSTKIRIGKLKDSNGRQLLTREAINQGSSGDNSAYLELSNNQISSGSTFYDNFIDFINGKILDNKGVSKTLLAANQGLSTREFVESSFEGSGWQKTVIIIIALLLIIGAYFGGPLYMGLLLGFNNAAWPLIKGIASVTQGSKMTPEIGSGVIMKTKTEDIKKSLEEVCFSKNESLEKRTLSEIKELMEIDKAKKDNQKEKENIITKLNAKAKELSRVNSGLFPEFSKYMNYWVGSRTLGGMQDPAVAANLAAMVAAAGGGAAVAAGGGAALFSTAITAVPGACAGRYYGTNVVPNGDYSLNAKLAVQPELSTPVGGGLPNTDREDYSGIFTLGDYSNLLNTIREDFNIELSEKAVVLEKIKTRWDETENELTQIKNNLNTGANTSTNIFATLGLGINTLEYGAGRTTIVVEDTMNHAANVTAFKKTIELMKKRVTDNEQKLTEYYKVLKAEYKKKEKKSGDKEYAKIPDLIACSDEQSKDISKKLSKKILEYIKDIGIVGRGRIGNRDFVGIIYKVSIAAGTNNVGGAPTRDVSRQRAQLFRAAVIAGVGAAPPLPYVTDEVLNLIRTIVDAGNAAGGANDAAGSDAVMEALTDTTWDIFKKEDIGDTPILHPTKGGPAAGNNGIITEIAYGSIANVDPGAAARNTLNPANFMRLTNYAGFHDDCMKTYYRLIHSEDRLAELTEIRNALAGEVDKINNAGAYASPAAPAVEEARINLLDDNVLARDIRAINAPGGVTNPEDSAKKAALEATSVLRTETFALANGQQYIPAGWENARKLEDVFNFNEDERYEPYFDLYFRVNVGKKGNAEANKASQQSYNLTTVKHIMGKAKILYLLEKYEKQERLLLPEKEKLKELEKMKKQFETSGLSLGDRLSGFNKDLKGESKIVVKILKRNGLGDKVGVIKSAYGITVAAFLNLAKDTSICAEIGKKYGFTSLENKAFVVSVEEVKQYYDDKTREKEAEETKKEADKQAKEEKKKAGETATEEKKQTEEDKKKEEEKDKLTEDLKEEITETDQPEEDKQKKLETIKKIEQIEKEQKQEDKKEDTESEIKIKQLEQKTEKDLSEIKNLTNETELTKKAINEVVKELQKSRRGSIEFTEHARELLIDHLGRLKKKREIQEKKLSDMVYEKERVSQLLTEMKKEEQFILKEKLQLDEEKKQFREQQRKYLLDKAKMEQTIRQLQTRESNQKKRTLRKQIEPFRVSHVESGPPISFTSSSEKPIINKGKIRTPQKKVKKPKQFTRKKPKREKKESFIESLTPDFLKTQ